MAQFNTDETIRRQEIRAVAVQAAAAVLGGGQIGHGVKFSVATLELAEELEKYITSGS